MDEKRLRDSIEAKAELGAEVYGKQWRSEKSDWVKLGEARDYIAEGNIELTGKTPLSPNGGLIGEAYIHGMNNITEAVRQIRGTAANPVAGVENVLVSSGMRAAILGRG